MPQLLFHLMIALRYPRTILSILLRNRAPLLPLSLPSLTTAAVASTFILVFKVRLAAFMSAVGVLTGALAGGLEN